MSIIVQDNFNVSDGTLLTGRVPQVGSAWGYQYPSGDAFRIYDNRLSFGSGNVLNGTTMPNNQYAQAIAYISEAGGVFWTQNLFVRANDAMTEFYCLSMSIYATAFRINLTKNTIPVSVWVNTVAHSQQLICRLEAIGGVVRVLVNGVEYASLNDGTPLVGGKVGVGSNNGGLASTRYFDNFEAGSAGPPPPPTNLILACGVA